MLLRCGGGFLIAGRCVLVGHAKHPIGFSCKSLQTSSYEVVKGSYKPTTIVALAEEETNTEVIVSDCCCATGISLGDTLWFCLPTEEKAFRTCGK